MARSKFKNGRWNTAIIELLLETEVANTHEVNDYLKTRFRHAPTMNQIGNFLSKSPYIAQVIVDNLPQFSRVGRCGPSTVFDDGAWWEVRQWHLTHRKGAIEYVNRFKEHMGRPPLLLN